MVAIYDILIRIAFYKAFSACNRFKDFNSMLSRDSAESVGY